MSNGTNVDSPVISKSFFVADHLNVQAFCVETTEPSAEPVWKQSLPIAGHRKYPFASVITTSTNVIVGAHGHVSSYLKSTGEQTWSISTPVKSEAVQLYSHPGSHFFLSTLYTIECRETGTGKLKWRTQLPDKGQFTLLTFTEESYLCATTYGSKKLYMLQKSDGTVVASPKWRQSSSATGAITADHTAIVTDDNAIQEFAVPTAVEMEQTFLPPLSATWVPVFTNLLIGPTVRVSGKDAVIVAGNHQVYALDRNRLGTVWATKVPHREPNKGLRCAIILSYQVRPPKYIEEQTSSANDSPPPYTPRAPPSNPLTTLVILAFGRKVFALDLDKGSFVWRLTLPSRTCPATAALPKTGSVVREDIVNAVITDDSLLITSKGVVYDIHIMTGKIIWQIPLESEMGVADIAVEDEKLAWERSGQYGIALIHLALNTDTSE